MAYSYSKTVYVNNSTPAINAANLNNAEEGIFNANQGVFAFAKEIFEIHLHDIGVENAIPFYVTNGDTLTIKTDNNAVFTLSNIYYLDADKTLIGYHALAGYGSKRTVTYSSNTDCCFIYVAGTAQNATVTNNRIKNLQNANLLSTQKSLLIMNCAELMTLFQLDTVTHNGITFTPSNFGKTITISGTPSDDATYHFYIGSLADSPFVAGNKYTFKFNAPTGASIQVVCGSTVVLNTSSFDGTKTITIPSNATAIDVRIYCLKTTIQTGTANVSIYNERELDYLEVAELDKKISYNQLSASLGGSSENIFSGIDKTDGKYVSYSDGKLYDNTSYSTTDFFPVFPGASYNLAYYNYASQIAFYTKDKVYVSGFVTNSNTINIPNNDSIAYARWCGSTSSYNSWGLYLLPIVMEKIIDTAEGLLEGVIDATNKGYSKIIVKAGTYDLISEYKAKYGNNYFANYTSDYNGEVNGNWDRGIWLNNVEIYFEPGCKVNALYEGDNGVINANVRTYFSAFAMGQNVVIDGLVLDGKNLRYGIHPDWHSASYGKLVIRNCDLHQYRESSPSIMDNQAIGAGLDVHSDWLIENCIFRSDSDHAVVRIHNNVSADSESKITIKNCYIVGNGYILLNSYSTSTHQTMAIVTNCSWKNPAVVGKETEESNDNITMYAWNNEVRNS